MKNNKLVAIDLFCGCGGFSYGFQQAGFDMALGIDMWKDATVTYKHNFPNACVINEDITSISSDEILSKLNMSADDIDVIIGGPPCQGFSVSGKRMIDDPRNKLYKSFVGLVDEIRPKVFVMENVPGLIRLFGGKVKEQVLYDFSSLGYRVKVQQLSSDDYGVPQQRKRVFFVGVNEKKIPSNVKFEFPKAEYGDGKKPYITCKEAISDLKELFQTADLVKFAKHDPQMNENDANLINAIDFINETKQPEEENQKPQPTEITIIEKRSLRTKVLLICGIAILSTALIGTFIYIGMQLYNLFA